MPQFSADELRYHVKSIRSAARDLIFNLNDDAQNYELTAPIGNEVSRAFLNNLEQADSLNNNGEISGFLPSSMFLEILRDNNLVESREQGEALVTAFGDWLRVVDYRKWWRSLGIEPPADHINPELLFDTLPQPFRTIMKVLEQDILDGAWDILAHRHPELVGGTRGDGPPLELENLVEGTAAPSVGAVTAICGVGGRTSDSTGAPALTSSSTYSDLMITGTATGSVDVIHTTGDVLASLKLKEVLTACSANILMTQDGIDKIGGITMFSETCDSLTHPLRFALTASDLTEGEGEVKKPEAVQEEPIPVKAKGKKGTAQAAAMKENPEQVAKPSSSRVKSVVAVLEYWPSTTPPLSAVAINGATAVMNTESGGLRRRSASSPSSGGGDAGGVLSTPERSGVGSRKRSLSSASPAPPVIGVASARLSLVCAGLIQGDAAVTRLSMSPDGRWLGLSAADGNFTMHALPPRSKLVVATDSDDAAKMMDKIDEERNEGDDNDEGHTGASSQKITAVPLAPPVVVLPPPPPPPSYAPAEAPTTVKPEESIASSVSTKASSAPTGKAKGKEDKHTKDSALKPLDVSFDHDMAEKSAEKKVEPRWVDGMVARCLFLQGQEAGGAGRRDAGSERLSLHITGFVIWRPASNVIRKYSLSSPLRATRLLMVVTQAMLSATKVGDVALRSSDEREVERSIAAASSEVQLVSEFIFSSPVTTIALTPTDESGFGPSNLLLNLAAIGTLKGTVLLWDLDSGCLRTTLGNHHAPVTSLLFTSITCRHHHHHQHHHHHHHHQHHHHHNHSSPHHTTQLQHTSHQTHHRRTSRSAGRDKARPEGEPTTPAGDGVHLGRVRLISASSDGVVHLWAPLPQRILRPIDRFVDQKMQASKISQRLTQRMSDTRELDPVSDPAAAYEVGDDGSGLLAPILLKTSELKDTILWLACPSDAALLVAQTSDLLVVYDLEELMLIGALGFNPTSPPLTRSAALGPAFRKPLGEVLPGLPLLHPLEVASSDHVVEEVGSVAEGPLDNSVVIKPAEQFSVCCYSSGVSIVCSTDELRKYGLAQETEQEMEPKKDIEETEDLAGFGSPSFSNLLEEAEAPASSLVMRFSCADLASLCVGVAQWMKLNGGAEGSAIVDAFHHLTVEQRKNAALVVEACVARPASPTGTALSDFNRTPTASSRGSRKSVSHRTSMTATSKTSSEPGGEALVGELTAENLSGGNPKSNEANILGFNQRFLPSSAYVLRELSSRQPGKHDRELRLLARRRELLELLPP